MRIAILGWGSLLWEGGREFDEQHERWENDGPRLNIEFSRISTSRHGALTLVIDDTNGSPAAVAWCLSKRQTVEDAICDLRCREGTTVDKIGRFSISKKTDPTVPSAIKNWATAKKLDAVIWTALMSNFEVSAKKPFSIEAAIEYIKTLDACGKAKAAEYIWRAPDFVQTSVRDALQREPWFAEEIPHQG
jgi:hypothetical protein